MFWNKKDKKEEVKPQEPIRPWHFVKRLLLLVAGISLLAGILATGLDNKLIYILLAAVLVALYMLMRKKGL